MIRFLLGVCAGLLLGLWVVGSLMECLGARQAREARQVRRAG